MSTDTFSNTSSPIRPGASVLVTGGASGIGLALCRAAVARDLTVVMVDRSEEALRAAGVEMAEQGGRVLVEVADVTDRAAMIELAERVFGKHGGVDVVVSNAGVVGGFGPGWETDPVEFRWVMDVNFFGVVNGVQAFTPHLIARGGGHLVNIASLAALWPVPFNGPYNSSKHAVLGFSGSLRDEFAQVAPEVGITVVCPGNVPTSLAATSRRNRPHAVPVAPSHVPTPPPATSSVTAETAAERIWGAVERRQFLHVTQPYVAERARENFSRLSADLGAI